MVNNNWEEEEKLLKVAVRLNAKMLGLILGLLFGLIIFLATNWLIIKGGPVTGGGKEIVGPHLKLLGQFFIGYKVSFLGSIIGFLYGFAVGTICGTFIGWIYNSIVLLRKQ